MVGDGVRMANSDRLYKNDRGDIFIPMNMEGSSWNEHFVTTPKLVAMGLCAVYLVMLLISLKSNNATGREYINGGILYVIITQFILRYIVFEERFYYRMYKEMKKSEITTPAIAWGVILRDEGDEGCILTYTDGGIGVIARLERDTIIGKDDNFREKHYDAISDFYKGITNKQYSFIQINTMEQAENNDRIAELDRLVINSDNENLKTLMNKQIGYMKNLTYRTLYETDYILIYTRDTSKVDYIMRDVEDCIRELMRGAFIGYSILKTKDIIELSKDEYGVKYFNYIEAMNSMFMERGANIGSIVNITDIIFNDGERIKIGRRETNELNRVIGDVSGDSKNINNIHLKEILVKNNVEKLNLKGVDFGDLSGELHMGVENIQEDGHEYKNLGEGKKGEVEGEEGKKRKKGKSRDKSKNKGKRYKRINEGKEEDETVEEHDINTDENEGINIENNFQLKQKMRDVDWGMKEDDSEEIDF